MQHAITRTHMQQAITGLEDKAVDLIRQRVTLLCNLYPLELAHDHVQDATTDGTPSTFKFAGRYLARSFSLLLSVFLFLSLLHTIFLFVCVCVCVYVCACVCCSVCVAVCVLQCQTRGGGLGSSREVGGWGRVPFSRNLMSPTPRRKWYLTTGRRAH